MKIQTFTGRMVDPCNPDPADIDLEDVAHALSHLCRFTGHASVFYSVAQHSLWVCDWLAHRGAKPVLQLAGLLHDASEAYLGDLNTPAKRQLRDYRDAEERVQRAVAEAFGLPFDLLVCRTVKEADEAAYESEKLALLDGKGPPMINPYDAKFVFKGEVRRLQDECR
ncbi:MAG: phosphohydrolase [Anaerolineae bacterium]|nr:phosphohydrolase [Anaerolineae bacterium]